MNDNVVVVERVILTAAERGLRTLHIQSKEPLQSLPLCIKRCKDSLEELYMDNFYDFEVIPAVVSELTRLHVLNVSYCSVSQIDSRVMQMTTLERLILSNNKLAFLPFEPWRLKKLKELRLDSNKFVFLPGQLLFLPQLRMLSVENNPLYTLDDKRAEMSREHDFNKTGTELDSLAPRPSYVDCENCYIRVYQYKKFVTFHQLCGHHDLPFIHYACSDVCANHIHSRIAGM